MNTANDIVSSDKTPTKGSKLDANNAYVSMGKTPTKSMKSTNANMIEKTPTKRLNKIPVKGLKTVDNNGSIDKTPTKGLKSTNDNMIDKTPTKVMKRSPDEKQEYNSQMDNSTQMNDILNQKQPNPILSYNSAEESTTESQGVRYTSLSLKSLRFELPLKLKTWNLIFSSYCMHHFELQCFTPSRTFFFAL